MQFWLFPILNGWLAASSDLIQSVVGLIQLAIWVGGGLYYLSRRGRKGKETLEHTTNSKELSLQEKHDSSLLKYPTTPDEAHQNIETLLRLNEYESALVEAEKYLQEIFGSLDKSHPSILLTEAEIKVGYAKALLYINRTKGAIACLDDVIKDMELAYDSFALIDGGELRAREVLGLAYNHKGYISWMKYGHYEDALVKFDKATAYLNESKEHLATTFDNMGRVYGSIGYKERAELLILKGLALRIQTGDDYRKALSLNSLAIITLAFGNPQRAYQLSCKAYQLFANVHRKETIAELPQKQAGARGMGLATITKAQSLRAQGAYWHHNQDPEQEKKSQEFLEEAVRELEFALAIFRETTKDVSGNAQTRLNEENIIRSVKEPIRRYQVLNELGCVYREYSQMLRKKNLSSGNYEREAIKYFEMSKAVSSNELTHYLDTVEDLAQLLFSISDTNYGRVLAMTSELQEKIKELANEHLIQKGANHKSVAPDLCLEDIWRHLAKLHILIGEIQLGRLPKSNARQDGLRLAVENYFVASLYLQRFLSRPLATDNAHLYPIQNGQNSFRPLIIRRFINDLCNVTYLQHQDIEEIHKALDHFANEYGVTRNKFARNIYLNELKDSLGILLILRGYS